MKHTTLIFALDDEQSQLDAVKLVVEAAGGFKVVTFLPAQTKDFLRRAVNEKPDLIILDHHLTQTQKGTQVLAQLRDLGVRSAMVFLSGERDVSLRVGALDGSADDFIAKPFSPAELVARIKAILRRHAKTEDPRIRGDASATDPDFVIGGVTFSSQKMTMTGPTGLKTNVSPYLLAVSRILHLHPGAVVTRKEIIHSIWGADMGEDNRTLDTAIYDLRKRIGRVEGNFHTVDNVRGVGYRYDPNAKPK